MKILGLIGGMSYVSTLDYYKIINQSINAKLGGLNAAECIIHSFNYETIVGHIEKGRWELISAMVIAAALNLKAGGAEAIIICANTIHIIADEVQENINLPVIHIGRETAKFIKNGRLNKVGLLGTKPTMELPFFKEILNNDGIEVITPDIAERDYIHQSVFDELGRGIFTERTKLKYLEIIENLINKGAEGVILGCTEIPLLIGNANISIPLFNTTQIHAEAGARFSLGL